MEATKSGSLFLGCVGKCTSGLTIQELDRITDHIFHTLSNEKGKEIFKKYLHQGNYQDALNCLDFYELCSKALEDAVVAQQSLDNLINDANTVLSSAEELHGVPEIDMAILERFSDSIDKQSKEGIVSVLEESKLRIMNHLTKVHEGFRMYVQEPCPNTKK